MLMQLTDIEHYFGSTPIFSGVNLRLQENTRAGLIGPNGCGKTTFLRIVCGELEPTRGTVTREAGARIGYVPQIVSRPPETTIGEFVLERVLEKRIRLREIEHELSGAEPAALNRLLAAYEKVREDYDANEGDLAEGRAERSLEWLGLPADLDRPIGTLSGGELNTLAVVRALNGEPDLLILDEPGNHLDLQGIGRLEQFLSEYRKAFLIVSHNRHLLDRTCNEILEFDRGALVSWAGNYSAYRLSKLQSLVAKQADYQANQKRLTRMRELVKLFEERARQTNDGAWGKRLRAQRSRLLHEEAHAVDRPVLVDRTFSVRFEEAESRADIALRITDYKKAYGPRSLFDSASAELRVGERVALVGPNGCGKSTMIDDIVATGSWDNDVLKIGPSMRIGYLSQKQKHIDAEKSVIDHLRDLAPMTRDSAFRTLSQFLFSIEDMDRPAGTLSGGERSRLQLAMVMLLQPNFLILDEPTNHLDVFAQESIEEALDAFDGTILFVSHDRYFIEKIAQRGIEVSDRHLISHDESIYGFISRYATGESVGDRSLAAATASGGRNARSASTVGRDAATGATPNRDAAERRIIELERTQRELERRIAGAFERGDHRSGRSLSEELAQVVREIDRAYEQWK